MIKARRDRNFSYNSILDANNQTINTEEDYQKPSVSKFNSVWRRARIKLFAKLRLQKFIDDKREK